MPTIEIAGLCLPLKPQKERGYNNFIRDRYKMPAMLDSAIVY
jgi:hypothetical protein